MILLYVFLALGTWKGVLGQDNMCDKRLNEVCVLPDDWRLPANEAEFKWICPILLRRADCLVDYAKNCESENEVTKKNRQMFKVLVGEACQENSTLHSRIVENIGCLHESVLNDFLQGCQGYLKSKTNGILKHMESIAAEKGQELSDLDEEYFLPQICLIHAIEMVCWATKSKARCGSDARDVVLEVVPRSGYIKNFCATANGERLAEYIDILEFESEEEKNAFNRLMGQE